MACFVHGEIKMRYFLLFFLLVICACSDVECPIPTKGVYQGTAIVQQDGCTLTRGDVAPFDALIDVERFPAPDEQCHAYLDDKIDQWMYSGEIIYVSPGVWLFDGTVTGKHCTLSLLITAKSTESPN